MKVWVSPIGLGMWIAAACEKQAEKEEVFYPENKPKDSGELTDIYHLMYRIRPPPRPP